MCYSWEMSKTHMHMLAEVFLLEKPKIQPQFCTWINYVVIGNEYFGCLDILVGELRCFSWMEINFWEILEPWKIMVAEWPWKVFKWFGWLCGKWKCIGKMILEILGNEFGDIGFKRLKMLF